MSQPELALEAEPGPEDAAEGVEDGFEDDKEFLMHGLQDEMLDACARWKEATSVPWLMLLPV